MTDPRADHQGQLVRLDEAALPQPNDGALQPHLPDLAPDDRERVDAFVGKASAEATLRAYRSDFELWRAFAAERGYRDMPASPDTVAAFLTHLAAHGTGRSGGRGLAPSSIGRRLAAIVFAHRVAGQAPPTEQPGAPTLLQAMRGIRRDGRGRPRDKKRAADGDVLRDVLRSIDGTTLRDARDRALLAIGMGGAFRRSELVGIRVGHVAERANGLVVRIPFSKADQLGEGETVVIPAGRRIEPMRLYREWRDAGAIGDGWLFRKLTPQGRLTDKPMSAQGVAIVVKQRVAAAGYDPREFSGHSLRAGFMTQAGMDGANPFKMKDHSRHRSLEMVAEYVRDHERFREHAGEGFL